MMIRLAVLAWTVLSLGGGTVLRRDVRRDVDEGIQLKISNGDDATAGEFPFVGALLANTDYESGQVSGQNICGASILSANVILTAAHCVVKEIKSGESSTIDQLYHTRDLTVYVGELSLSDTESTEQVGTVKGLIVHKDYHSFTVKNDIALIILENDLDLSGSAVSAIGLPDSDTYYAAGAAITVIGWGTTESGETSETLQKLPYTVTLATDCTDNYGDQIADGMMCSGSSPDILTKHSGTGDSGGPLFVKQSDNSFLQLGLVSWGPETQSSTSYDVNTNVYYFKSWITESMSNVGDYSVKLTATDTTQSVSYSKIRNFFYKAVTILPTDSKEYVQITVKSGTLNTKDYVAVYDGIDVNSDKMLAQLTGTLTEKSFTGTTVKGLTMVIVTSTSASTDTFTVEYKQVETAGNVSNLYCGSGYYACQDNYYCVTSYQVCDKTNHCVDGSDETTQACSAKSNGDISNFTDGNGTENNTENGTESGTEDSSAIRAAQYLTIVTAILRIFI